MANLEGVAAGRPTSDPVLFRPGHDGEHCFHQCGSLSSKPVAKSSARDPYTVNYSSTVGIETRWTSAVGGGLGLPPYKHMQKPIKKV